MPRHMMEAKEAAEYLKVSYWTLLEKSRNGVIPCTRVGRRVLYSQEGLDEWIEQQEAQSIKKEPAVKETGYGKLRKIKG